MCRYTPTCSEYTIEAIITAKLPKIKVGGKEVAHLEEGFTIQDIVAMTNKVETIQTDMGPVQRKIGYYSGADISGIVEEACRIALETIQEKKMNTAIPLTKDMFEQAFTKTPPSISRETLEFYENFRNQNSKK